MNVLVSAPSMYYGLTFIPYIYALLKRSCDSDDYLKNKLNWLKPIYTSAFKIKNMQEYISEQSIDVLALSCYEWNWDIQMDFARNVKKRNPNCLVVAGGPQPSWRSSQLFKDMPYVDIVIKGEGETPFREVAKLRLEGRNDFECVPGVITRNNAHKIFEVVQVREREFNPESAYLGSSEELSKIANEIRDDGLEVWANFESNRGCPYKCVFCDWGAATNSKIRKVEMNRLASEVEWFAKSKIDVIYITDANFGILERDEELVDLFIKAREDHGYPKTIFFNSPKNNPDRLVRIIKKLHASGLLNICIQNSLQSTQPHVLDVMKRLNVEEDKQRKFTQDIHNIGMPIGGALILGNPGESLEDFKQSMFDVAEWGMHDELRIFNWSLLPNAPAAAPEFVKKHKIKTIRRQSFRNLVSKEHINNPYMGFSDYLIEHERMSKKDYIEALIFSTYLLVFHYMSLTKYLSVFLRFEKSVSYKDFYEKLIFEFRSENKDIEKQLRDHFVKLAHEENSNFAIEIDEDLPALYDAEAWLFLKIIDQIDDFYKFVDRFADEYFEDKHLKTDLVKYNKNMIITLDYKPEIGRHRYFKYDWKTYFDQSITSAYPKSLGVPHKGRYRWSTHTKLTGHYMGFSLEFNGDYLEKLSKYLNSVVGTRSLRHRRSVFQSFEFELVALPVKIS